MIGIVHLKHAIVINSGAWLPATGTRCALILQSFIRCGLNFTQYAVIAFVSVRQHVKPQRLTWSDPENVGFRDTSTHPHDVGVRQY